MTLTRATVTRASRIMLPAYVVLFTLLGLNYTLTNKDRLLYSPGLAYAEQVISLRAWGLLFLTVAVLMAAALLSHRRTLYRFGLWLCIVSMTTWASILAAAAMLADASPSAWVWPGFVAVACYASHQSLLAREV